MAQSFDFLNIPICGTNLIEASAGTGKTYSIAALYTRLLLLENYTVDNILVVTFARAATAELKTRLRAYLEKSRRLLSEPEPKESGDFLDVILPAAIEKAGSKTALLERIKSILAEFDNASIYTLHGFCQRLLRDYAFLCEVPFDVELSNDPDPFLLQAAQDFWRQHITPSAEFSSLFFQKKFTPQTCLDAFRHHLKQPYLTTYRPDTTQFAAIRQEAEKHWCKLQANLPVFRQHFDALQPFLNQNSYNKATFNAFFDALANLPNGTLPEQQHFSDKKFYTDKILKAFSKLTADELTNKISKKNLNKDGSLPDELQKHINVLDKLGQFAAVQTQINHNHQQQLTAVLLDMFHYLRDAVQEHKKSHSRRDFDDLLIDAHHALTQGPHREKLAETVTRQWQIGLIDEFQDTDAVQYAIFRTLFINHHLPLFLVGDPKQAIYGFRGADIFTYLQAARDADAHYTLTTNHRSYRRLVNSIHALFRRTAPFVLPQIDYPPVAAHHDTPKVQPLDHALHIRWLTADNEHSVPKTILNPRAAECCADEIADLLNRAAQGCLKRKNEPLQAKHIAVLVRSHEQSNLVAHALKQRGIRSVRVQKKSVYDTSEARAVEQLLAFWLVPQQTRPLYYVLASNLFSFTAHDLHSLQQDDAQQSDYIQAAVEAYRIWQENGIYAAIQFFAGRYGLESCLLARGNERGLTNYHQLIELLAEAEERGITPHALHQWLQQQIANTDNSGDSTQLRLESDENLVQIVTMHTSKGLQYPVVFCPFVWSASQPSDKSWQTIRTDTGMLLLAPEQTVPDHINSAYDPEQTALGEDLRLLYVALTRAEDQLHLYAADAKSFQQTALNYLLPDLGKDANIHQRWQQWLSEAQNDDTDIVWHDSLPPAAQYQPINDARQTYSATIQLQRPFQHIRFTSFTGLTAEPKHPVAAVEEMQPTIDPAEARQINTLPETVDTDNFDIFHFPKGTTAGLCLHEILETFDFSRPANAQQESVVATLAKYSFPDDFQAAVVQTADAVSAAPLNTNITLADIPPSRRIAEMGFLLHINDFHPQAIQQWLQNCRHPLPETCIQAARTLNFQTVNGFLNGFIDLTALDTDGNAYVIDYKSNHLGMSPNDYTATAIADAVAQHHYYLQAFIYAVAVARYLHQRQQLPKRIFVRYLFLRGLDNHGSGVWSWQIDTDELMPWLFTQAA